MMEIRYSYAHVPTIRAFSRSDAFVRGLMGPFGSGKSSGCVVELLRRAQAQQPMQDGVRRTRWAVVRNTYPQLRDTTIKTFFRWAPPSVNGGPGFGQYKETTHDYVIRAIPGCEVEVMFRALDRPDHIANLLSLDLTGAWVNEGREVPWSLIEGLQARARRYPPMNEGGPTWGGVIVDSNPPDNDSRWYRFFEEDRPSNAELFKQPSARGPHAENLANLPADYYQNLMQGKDEDWIRVYVDGEYGFVREGKPVYPEYRDNLHCREFDLNPRLPLYVGIDFGLTPAATIAQRDVLGRWRVHGEVCTEDMGAVRFREVLAAVLEEQYSQWTVEKYTGDPAGDSRAQTDETTPFQILRAGGIEAVPAPTNDLTIRREAVATTLSRLIDGEPGLLIHPRCKWLRKGMAGGYQYRRLAVSGAERFHDRPDKNIYSHVCESLQYLLLGAGEGAALMRKAEQPKQKRVDRGVYLGEHAWMS